MSVGVDELLRHGRWLRRLADRLVSDRDRADDLVQETWLAALRRRPRRGASLRPWLATVLRNLAVSRLRGAARREDRELGHARPESTPSVEELTARAELSRGLVEAVLRLPEAQREVVLLRYFEGLSGAEIARRLEHSAATVRSQLARGLEALRIELDRESGGDRSRWMACLAPLLPSAPALPASTLTLGALAMTNTVKWTAGVALTLVLGVGALWTFGGKLVAPEDPDSPGVPDQAVLDPASGSGGSDAEAVGGSPLASSDPPRSEPGLAPGGPDPGVEGPVEGQLVDARTGEPLPWFALGLGVGLAVEAPLSADPPPVLERLVTDAEGHFRSQGSFGAGPMHLVLLEDWDRWLRAGGEPRTPLGLSHSPEGDGGTRFELESGPCFAIRSSAVESLGVERFRAQLSSSDGGEQVGTHLFEGEGPWARFLPLEFGLEPGDFDTLELRSADRRWVGRAAVEPRPGPDPVEVAIELHPCGSLDLKIRADAAPELEGAEFALWAGELDAVEASEREPIASGMTSLSIQGSFLGLQGRPRGSRTAPSSLDMSVSYLEVGTYTLLVRSSGCDDHRETVEVVQGSRVHPIVLHRSESSNGRLGGRVRTRSGMPPEVDLVAWIDPQGESGANAMRMAELEVAPGPGPWEASFEFTGLPDREYRMWITRAPHVPRDTTRRPRFEGRDRRVHLGDAPVEFLLLDDEAKHPFEVEVLDRGSGDPLDAFRVAVIQPALGKEPPIVDGRQGLARLELVGDLTGAFLWISAEGYAPHAFGSLPSTPDEDGVLRTTIDLLAGWGAPVQVLTLEDGGPTRPLDGVEVRADGVPVGVTDERGILMLSLAERPTTLTVEAPQFRIERVSGPIEDDGQLKRPPKDPMSEAFTFVLAPGD